MRIHLVSEHASPLALLGGVDAGGQNVHVAALATALAERGSAVTVHTRRDDPTLPRRVPFAAGVTVDHVDAGPPEPIPKDDLLPYMGAFANDLTRQWQRQTPDVVHAHFWMSALAAKQAGDRLGIPVAVTYHALGVEKRRHQGDADTSPAVRCGIETWLAMNADHVIATSRAERRTLVGFGAHPSDVTVVPCGVDLDLFRPGVAWTGPPSFARSDRPRVVCVSRLVPRKGIADVVAAVAGLPGVELLIAGGPQAAMLDDDPYACELNAMIERLGVADRVQLVGGIDRAAVPGLMGSADVVCCTPWYEPFGMVAVEAMACGIPVVATAVGGLAETVVNDRTGVHVPPQRPDLIRAAIHRLLHDRRAAAAMRTAAVARAAQFGWPSVAARTHAVLGRLPNRRIHDAEAAASAVRPGGAGR